MWRSRLSSSRRANGHPIPYALETDWLAGVAGFEPLHLRIEIRETLSQDSKLCISELDPLLSIMT
jgi:hypothetical protein